MSATDDLERRLTAWLEAQAPMREPEALAGSVADAVGHTGRLPGWAIPERWIPMTLTLRPATVPRALIILLALAMLLGALIAGGMVTGSFRHAMVSVPDPTGLARNGLIAYSDLGDLWLVDEHGQGRRQLTSGPELDYPGAWSPDGSWLAYWSVRYAGDPSDAVARNRAQRVGHGLSIKLIRPGDGESRTIASGLDWSASGETGITWSPDGTRIAFDHRASTGTEAIEVVGLEGGPGMVLATTAVTPAWSPDGSVIAYTTARYFTDPDGAAANGFGVMSVPVGGGEPRPISRAHGNDAAFFWPQWSNDSRRVLFGAGDVYVAEADGAGETALTSTPDIESHPRWSPANDRIAFLRSGSAGHAVVVADADGTDEVVLGGVRPDPQPPVWSPDGRRLLVATRDEQGQPNGIAVLDAVSTDPAVTIAGSGVDGFGQAAWQRLAP